MHRADRRGHLLVGERDEPAHAAVATLLGEVKPQRLYEQQRRELLRDDDAARLRLAELLTHSLDDPVEHRLVGFVANVHERRQHAEEHVRLVPRERELAAHAEEMAAALEHRDAPVVAPVVGRRGIDRRDRKIARDAKRPSARKQHAVAGRDRYGVGHSIDREPAVAGDHRVEADSVEGRKREGPVAPIVEPAGPIGLHAKEREHV